LEIKERASFGLELNLELEQDAPHFSKAEPPLLKQEGSFYLRNIFNL